MDRKSDPRARLTNGNPDQASGAANNRLAPPSISLPKGGGAIRGIGEKFATNPVTGTGSVTVPIATSPGRSGFGPQLSLSYDSGAGNGPFGFGWNLSLPSITRKTEKGLPRYRDEEGSDGFILSAAEDLVPLLVETDGGWQRETPALRIIDGKQYQIARYRPRIEGLFARIERWTNQADSSDTFWRSISRDNITSWYGKSPESRIVDFADGARIFSWLICESYDDKGNAIVYNYKQENSAGIDLSQAHERNRHEAARAVNRYLKRIKYGNRTPYLPELVPNKPPTPQPAEWLFEAVFDYGEHDLNTPGTDDSASEWPVRRDPFSTYRAGFEVRAYRLCRRVLMFHHFPGELGTPDYLVRSTDFTYTHEQAPHDPLHPNFSFLLSAAHWGYKLQTDGSYLKKSLPPLEFEYSQPVVSEQIHEADPASLANLPYGLDNGHYQWVDLDGEGISGVLTEQAGAWFYKRNLSPVNGHSEERKETMAVRFGAIERVAETPSLSEINSGSHQFLDLAGDGQLDLVELAGATPGFYERTHDRQWMSFRPFTSLPVLNWNNPNLRFVDLTGDGYADILISEDEAFCWHPSLAETGFGPAQRVRKALDEEEGPRLLFADGSQSIYLADFSGDGMMDLVRVRNGEVSYWPNLGYGRFGAKVTMDNAPWFDAQDVFDQSRIRLADIDGTGLTDIIYLGGDGVHLYFNESGNSWSAPRHLTNFPAIDSLASVQAADLLGNGTVCLVWSSPLPGAAERSLRYIDLMGGRKPHLLVKSVNNLGAEVHVRYAPSTKFYLADKLAGKPWISKIPFPVHVVERVETYDRISRNRFVTRYAYHHGYFDGIEREFRGFALVEQWDTEEFAALGAAGELPSGDNINEASHVPPVLTKTWFHTGVHVGRDHVSNFFAGLRDEKDRGEYYREPGLDDDEARRLLLDDTVLPAGLTLEEEREACRALKGAMLRREVYALDGTEKEAHPYVVTEQNFTIRMLQPKAGNNYGVFFTHAREAITYQYERYVRKPEDPRTAHALTDPRIGHVLTLEVDDFGNVLKSVAAGYGRRRPDASLSQADQATQAQLLLTYTENAFTNSVDGADMYRAPLPSETRTYELTGYIPAGPAGRFQAADLVQPLSNGFTHIFDREIPYEETPDQGKERRLIEHVRTLYRPNDLGLSRGDSLALLPLGQLESLAIPGESYKLAFTNGLVTKAYGGKVTDAMLEGEGRYVRFADIDGWWIPSGRIFLSPNTDDAAANELAHARDHFFLPRRMRDPFHRENFTTESILDYEHDLLVIQTRDALGNVATARNDYRVLQPSLLADPNGNRSEAAFDTLGMVVGTAVMGKQTENKGDTLAGFNADLDEAMILAHLHNPLTDPHAILQGATTRLVYDLFAYHRTKNQPEPEPAVAYALARETHVSDLAANEQTRIQHSFTYSDGFGREIQKKIQAKPGPIVEGGTEVNPRWVGSGWTVFNNKGKPIRQFEPFFTATHRFEFNVRIGVSPILFYDPVERVVATLHPNHTWQKVVFDPWHQETWDVTDTVLLGDPAGDPDVGEFLKRLEQENYLPTWHAARFGGAMGIHEQTAARKSELHAGTPALAYMDSLGRTFLTVAHNKFERKSDGTVETLEEKYPTRFVLDIEGNQREVIDAKNRAVMRYDYNLLGNQIHSISMDAGERWMLSDVAGQPIRAWDARGHEFRTEYDQLRRPVCQFVRGTDPAQSDPRVLTREILFQKTEYGEGQANADTLNLRTRSFRSYDNAGIATSEEYDFKGNLLRGTRQLASDYKNIPDWAGSVELDSQLFTSHTAHDALNRPINLVAPDNSEIKPTYNEANLLEQITVNLRGETRNHEKVWTSFVEQIDYNAKGQRELVEYGNEAQTTYEYDPLTFRLINLKTTRDSDGDLQNLSYVYDPAGNVTYIKDTAQQTIFFGNTKITPDAEYTYDAIYRLIEATGREHIGQTGQVDHSDPPIHPLPHPNDVEAMRPYIESYGYDEVGNILEMIHQANGGSWTRGYQCAIESNRLLATSQPGDGPDGAYDYNLHGSMTRMPHLPLMAWDFAERMQATSKQVFNDGTPETTYYVYDSAGQRVRKVTELQNGIRHKERLYLGGLEIYREYGGTDPSTGSGQASTLKRETLHIMDDKHRVALVETKTIDAGSPVPTPVSLIRYQLGSHLGSATLELDDAAQVISYEEYYPYGATSYRAANSAMEVSVKRYRYTGKEKDDETGLYYHGARYYAPWLGIWTAIDPLLLERLEVSPYLAFANSPLRFVDPDGQKPLVESDFRSLDDLKKEISIDYTPASWKHQYLPQTGEIRSDYIPAAVTVSHANAGFRYSNELSESTLTEDQLEQLKNGGAWDKTVAVRSHPELLYYRDDLEAVVKLSYAPQNSAGTALFYVAEEMSRNIQGDNPSRYINAIKHVFGQSMITTLRGRNVADFVGDIHERKSVSGVFATRQTQQQNLTSGFATQNRRPQQSDKDLIDAYIDLINNTYGQHLGEQLRTDLGVSRSTYWTPELTAEYLNAVQQYLGAELNLQFKDFAPDSATVRKFTNLINEVQKVETPPAEIERQQYEQLGMPH